MGEDNDDDVLFFGISQQNPGNQYWKYWKPTMFPSAACGSQSFPLKTNFKGIVQQFEDILDDV